MSTLIPTPKPRTSARSETTESAKDATRRRILDAARPVFLRDGFLAANLNEVARGAGVGKGTLYRHFENKGELYLAVLAEPGEGFLHAMRDAVDFDRPAPEQIEQVARFYLDYWTKHPEYFKIIWAVQNPELIGPLSEELAERVRAVFEKPIRLVEGLIRAGVERGEIRSCDAWHTANVIAVAGSAVVGHAVGAQAHILQRDTRAMFDQMLDILLAGLAPER